MLEPKAPDLDELSDPVPQQTLEDQAFGKKELPGNAASISLACLMPAGVMDHVGQGKFDVPVSGETKSWLRIELVDVTARSCLGVFCPHE